jgi:MOB kinase activator 1
MNAIGLFRLKKFRKMLFPEENVSPTDKAPNHSPEKKGKINDLTLTTKLSIPPSLEAKTQLTENFKFLKGKILDFNINHFAKCPAHFTYKKWLIYNAKDFLSEMEKVFTICSLFCTDETCPLFTCGHEHRFTWKENSFEQFISAPAYFSMLKVWSRTQLNSPQLFDLSTDDLSKDAFEVLRTIFCRLMRLLGHILICHTMMVIQISGLEEVLNTILVRFTMFAIQQSLVAPLHLIYLRPVYKKIGVKLNWKHSLYVQPQLPSSPQHPSPTISRSKSYFPQFMRDIFGHFFK